MSKGPKSFPYIVALTGLIMIGVAAYGEYTQEKQLANQRWEEVEDLKDCRMQLHAYILRQRGEMEAPQNPNICHIDPLDEACACAKTRKK